ncbi:MAG: DUF1570 domain-containing protein [Planctomycetes bacterium]|nr:DUF1570 domain-containing protein [Planctomycetota bacterium]
MRTFVSIAFFAVLAVGASVADIVHLKNGKTMEGETEEEGDYIKITTTTGASIKFPKSLVAEIEKQKHPRQIYTERLDKLKPDDAEAHYKLALWCKEHGLLPEYGKLLQKTLQIDPEHENAQADLYEYQKYEKSLPFDEEAGKKLIAEFGPGFKLYRTPHYRICYDCDRSFLRRRSILFEKTYERFYRFFEEKGCKLDVISDRLEVALLDSREEFVSYIKVGQKRNPPPPGGYIPESMVMCAGFYSHATRRMLFYDALNDEQFKAIRKMVYSVPYSRLTRESKKRLSEYKSRLSLKTKVDQNVSVTVHEATHQLTFELGLLNPNTQNPTWLVEGIAMYFETANEGHWYGAGRLNTERLDAYHRIRNRPLLNMVLVNDGAFRARSSGSMLAAYAVGWALTYYLLEEHPEAFVKYLQLLRRRPDNTRYRPGERLKDFQSCFGEDLSSLGARWVEFMNKLKT